MVLRVSGFSSGLDIDETVKQLMQAQRTKVDKLLQQKQTLRWQREGYRDINSKILDFRNNKLFNYRLEGTFEAKKVNVTGGNSSAITAQASGGTPIGATTLEVTQLATASTYTGGKLVTKDVSQIFDSSKKLSDSSLTVPLADNTYTLNVNGKPLSINTKDNSLDSIISQINSQSDLNVFYDSYKGCLSFSTKETGAGKTIDFSGSDPALLFALGIVANPPLSQTGQNAIIKLNGLTTERPGNTFSVNGLSITLNSATESGKPLTLSTSLDTDKVVESVKKFITDYNDMLKTLNDLVDETRYRDYAPLTDDQKEAMKDSEVELWEKKAKSGLLRNDSIISKAISDMRMSVVDPVLTGNPSIDAATKYKTLSSMGITTGTYNEKGKLYLSDETKLRQAIETDPEAVIRLFTAKGNDDNDTSDVGVAERMYDSLQDTMNQIMKKVGYSSLEDSATRDESIIGKQMYDLATRIDSENSRLSEVENRYYKQFTAMETLINQYNSQSSYLSQAFSG